MTVFPARLSLHQLRRSGTGRQRRRSLVTDATLSAQQLLEVREP
jgi:hypothetical protein